MANRRFPHRQRRRLLLLEAPGFRRAAHKSTRLGDRRLYRPRMIPGPPSWRLLDGDAALSSSEPVP